MKLSTIASAAIIAAIAVPSVAQAQAWPATGKCTSTSETIRCTLAKGTKSFAVAGMMQVRSTHGATKGPWRVLKTRPGRVTISLNCDGAALSFQSKPSGIYTLVSNKLDPTLGEMLRSADCNVEVSGNPPAPRHGQQTQIIMSFAAK